MEGGGGGVRLESAALAVFVQSAAQEHSSTGLCRRSERGKVANDTPPPVWFGNGGGSGDVEDVAEGFPKEASEDLHRRGERGEAGEKPVLD